MTTRNLIFFLALITPSISFSQEAKNDSSKVFMQKISIEDIVDEIPPPSKHVTTNFKTIEDWLTDICINDKPNKSISTYKFGLFESSKKNILFLVGVNTYDKGGNSWETSIEFEPKKQYLKLSVDTYKNLSREKLIDTIITQLKNFVSTDKFKNSFLSKAKEILFETNGQIIWAKE